MPDRQPYVDATVAELRDLFAEQRRQVVSAWEQTGFADASLLLPAARWNRIVEDAVFLRNKITASDFGRAVADDLQVEFDPNDLDAFLAVNARLVAELTNSATVEKIQEAIAGDEPGDALRSTFDRLEQDDASMYAESAVTNASNFGGVKAAEQSGGTKTWVTTSGNPRSTHAAMSGTTVAVGAAFPNGLRWPGDPAGDAEQVANCRCQLTFSGGG